MNRSSLRTWLADLVAQVVGALALTALVFRVWDRPLRVPFVYSGDALTQASVVDGIITTGWWFTNPRLGAPEGFEGYDFPLGGEMAHYWLLKVGSWLSDDPYLLTNAYFLAGFALVAMSAFVALRVIGIQRSLAHPLALLYSFAPYHLLRGTEHLTLAAYWSVPLGAMLVWWVLTERAPLVRVDAHERPWRVHRNPDRLQRASSLAVMVLVAFGGAYYAVFTVVSLAVAGALVALRRRSWKALVPAAAVVVVIGALVVLSTAPSLAFWADQGRNPEAGRRPLSEQDVAPLRPIQLLTPVPDHRVGPLDELSETLLTSPSNSEPSQFLGVMGSVGLVVALASVAGAVSGRRSRWWSPEPEVGLLIVVLMLTGVAGGFDWLTGLAGLTEIRAWGRVSIVIAFWALVTLARPLTALSSRLAGRRWSQIALPVVVLAVGLADQIPRTVVDPRVNRGEFLADNRFYAAMEAELDTAATVFQLPYSTYPEAPRVNGLLAPSELLRPLLATDDLRWSFGAMRGRDADWMEPLVRHSVPVLIDDLAALGYAALTVDRVGYPDRGAEVEAELSAVLGAPVVSETGRIVWFDLRARREVLADERGEAALAARAQELRWTPTFWFTDGFLPPVPAPDGDQRWAGRASRFEVWNRSDTERRAVVRFEVRTLAPIDDVVVVDAAGSSRRVDLPAGQWVEVEVPMLLEQGRTAVSLVADGDGLPGDVRDVHLVVRNVSARFEG